MKIVMAILLGTVASAQIPDTTVFKSMKSRDTIKVNRDWSPRNLEECFKRLDEILPDSTKIKMKSGSENDMTRYHHGLGTHLRNSWGLWRGGELKVIFQ